MQWQKAKAWWNMANTCDFFPHGDSRHYRYFYSFLDNLCYCWTRHAAFNLLGLPLNILKIPVMAAIAVRKKVVRIGHFSPSFCPQSLYFFLLDQIKSNRMYWLHWKSEKSRTEPNELDELKYSLIWFFLFICSDKYQSIYLLSSFKIRKKT